MHAEDSEQREPHSRGFARLLQSVSREGALRRSYLSGEIVSHRGDPALFAHVVESGQIRVYRTSLGGREQVMAILGPGEAFNVAALFVESGSYRSTAEALTDATIVAIRRDELLEAVRRSPDLAIELVSGLAARLDGLARLVEDLSLRTVRARLARFLVRNASAGSVSRRWTQEEMASQLGTVRDVIGRSLRNLESEELIRIDRNRIVLINKDELESVAEI